MRITRQQSEALLRKHRLNAHGLSFLAFRRSVQPTIGCDDAIAVPWGRMWLCIETDGYTHT